MCVFLQHPLPPNVHLPVAVVSNCPPLSETVELSNFGSFPHAPTAVWRESSADDQTSPEDNEA